MKLKSTVTIGIPAFNEEKNIGNLLNDILHQKHNKVKITDIIIVSDRSTDKTAVIVTRFKDKRIKLIVNEVRLGKSLTQNEILKHTKTDFLVLLDADIKINDSRFIEKIISRLKDNEKIGLVSPRIVPLKSKTVFGKIIDYSVLTKNQIYLKKKDGDNIYLCHGRARVMSKKLYSQILWPSISSEDAFSYLFASSNGFDFRYVKNTEVFYRSPQNFSDHKKQSGRFLNSKHVLSRYFDKKRLMEEYKLPRKWFFYISLKMAIKNPFAVIYYAVVLLSVNFTQRKIEYKWSAASTSKQLES